MSIYNTVSDDYISNSVDKLLYDILYDSCYNLSAILGDTDGKISQTTISQLTKPLSITAPGIVVIGDTGGLADPNGKDSVVPLMSFDPILSSSAYSLYTRFILPDQSLVTHLNTIVTSPLLSLASQLPPAMQCGISAIYLESYSLYQQLISLKYGSTLFITRSDLTRIISNCMWVSYQIEKSLFISYDLVSVLRDLQRTLLYTRSLTQLFVSNYSTQVQELNTWIGGITDV